MAVFNWTGRTRAGVNKNGTLEAGDKDGVIAQLRAQGVLPISVKEKPKNLEDIFTFLQPKVETKELVIFTRQFAVMIDAGLPLVQCLKILGDNHDNPTFKRIIGEVRSQVESGSTFAEALARHPLVFDALFTNLIAAGEVGGILDTIMNRLATQLEKADKLARQLRGAMVYPATVSTIALAVIMLLMVKVIPVFEKMFSDFGGELPGPTAMVISISDFLQAYLHFGMAGLFVFISAFKAAYRKSLAFKYQVHRFNLKLPIFGEIIKKVAVARFTRTLGTMISSGVPILDALDITAKTSGNMLIEEELQNCRAAISEGKTLAEPMRESIIFPQMMVQMMAVGEETGSMEIMLTKIAEFYDDEVDVAVGALTSMLEPVMMVFMGGSIGTILIAMYLPIFKIADSIN